MNFKDFMNCGWMLPDGVNIYDIGEDNCIICLDLTPFFETTLDEPVCSEACLSKLRLKALGNQETQV